MIGPLANHLWQSTALAVVAALLAVACRGNRAQIRYWLWFSASIKFFVPFALLMALGSRLEWAPIAQDAAAGIASPAIAVTIDQFAQPFSDVDPAASPCSAGPESCATDKATLNWSSALAALWVSGFAAVMLIRWRLWRGVRAAVQVAFWQAPIALVP